MHNAEAAIEPAFYDHEDDNVQERERVAADWGADEVFATVPRRRFRDEHRGPSSPHGSQLHHPASVSRPRGAASRPAAGATQSIAAGRELDRETAHPAGFAAAAPATTAPHAPEALLDGVRFEESTHGWTEAPLEPGGRRTVVVTGRPDGEPRVPRALIADRRRPPREFGDRLGARPDRIAGWAFGMGMLLIAIAAASANASPL